jgi:hypothetical protein
MLLGAIQGSIRSVSLIAGVAGIYAAITGLYALFAKAIATEVRTAGTGFASESAEAVPSSFPSLPASCSQPE